MSLKEKMNLNLLREAKHILKKSPLDEAVSTREGELLGVPFVLEHRGFCRFNRIRLLVNGVEVYKIERLPVEGGNTRFEKFLGVLRRRYEDDQFSFCEYLDLTGLLGELPETKEILRRGLTTPYFAEMYRHYVRRFFGNGSSVPHVIKKEFAYALVAQRFDELEITDD